MIFELLMQGKMATSPPRSHIANCWREGASDTFAVIAGGGQNPDPSDLRADLISVPALISPRLTRFATTMSCSCLLMICWPFKHGLRAFVRAY